MSDSIHVARWLSQLYDEKWDLHLFSSTDNVTIHPDLKYLTIYQAFYSYQREIDSTVNIIGFPVFLKIFVRIGNKFLRCLNPSFRQRRLERIIEKIKPDIIHSMEFQSAGYLTLNVKSRSHDQFPPWVAANWGNDVYLFHRFPDHLEKIKGILKNSDYYLCECERDMTLAKKLGLKAKPLPLLPATGGFDLHYFSTIGKKIPPSQRKLIMIKGYHGWAGRGLIALDALELCKNDLTGYTFAIYLASPDVIKRVEMLSQSLRDKLEVIPYSPREKILEYFGKARIHIGLSISDGTPNTMLEAMIMGAFPIQSNTACADEWLEHGVSGLIVPPDDPSTLASAIVKAATDDDLVDTAAEINYKAARGRLSNEIIQPKVIEMYRWILRENELNRPEEKVDTKEGP
jgi:glycosyltransferase involved in cell wall biosynthesis